MSESVGSVCSFDFGWGGFIDLNQYRVLRCKVDKKDEIGDLSYEMAPLPLPVDVSLEIAKNLALSKDFPREFRKHVSEMSILDDHEIDELKRRGINFVFTGDVSRKDGFIQ